MYSVVQVNCLLIFLSGCTSIIERCSFDTSNIHKRDFLLTLCWPTMKLNGDSSWSSFSLNHNAKGQNDRCFPFSYLDFSSPFVSFLNIGLQIGLQFDTMLVNETSAENIGEISCFLIQAWLLPTFVLFKSVMHTRK